MIKKLVLRGVRYPLGVSAMRNIILATILVSLSTAITGARISIPKMQSIIVAQPLVITATPEKDLCKKYNTLFLNVLHQSLECTDSLDSEGYRYEECEELSRLVKEFGRLRSHYCYGEESIHL